MRTLYAVTGIRHRSGRSIVWLAPRGKGWESPAEAEELLACALLNNDHARLTEVTGCDLQTLRVDAVSCYDHGDPMGTCGRAILPRRRKALDPRARCHCYARETFASILRRIRQTREDRPERMPWAAVATLLEAFRGSELRAVV